MPTSPAPCDWSQDASQDTETMEKKHTRQTVPRRGALWVNPLGDEPRPVSTAHVPLLFITLLYYKVYVSETQKSKHNRKDTGLYSQVHTIAKKPNPPTATARQTTPPTTMLDTIELPALFSSGGGHQAGGALVKVHALWVR